MSSLKEILDEAGIKYYQQGEHHHATSDRYQMDCPFCSPEQGKYRLGIHSIYHYASCWTCGFVPFYKALELMTNISIRELRQKITTTYQEKEEDNKRGRLILPDDLGPLKRCHKDYLSSRGFNPSKIEKLWGLQGIGLSSKPLFSWRIFLPAFHNGKLVSWTTRGLTDKDPRYVNAKPEQEKISLKEILPGYDFVRHRIAVTEGYMDMMKFGTGCTTSCGMTVTKAQFNLIARIPNRLFLFDNEKEAQRKAKELCRDLSVFPGTTINIELDSKDLGSAPWKEIKKVRRFFSDL